MKRTLFYFIVALSVAVLVARFGTQPVSELLGYQSKAGLKVTSLPEAMVSVNGVAAGKTPYENENLKEGKYKVKLEENGALWEGEVTLTSGTLAIVNRELGQSIASSSGEILTLSGGRGVVITSSPSEADVEIDGKIYGKTPLSVSDLTPGDHAFVLNHANYLKRSIRASLPDKMTLYLTVDLAVSEADLGAPPAPISISSRLVVSQTPTGFLRVRDKPSLLGVEVGRLSSGDSVIQLEESSGWVKVRLDSGTEGYISSQYVQKQP